MHSYFFTAYRKFSDIYETNLFDQTKLIVRIDKLKYSFGNFYKITNGITVTGAGFA